MEYADWRNDPSPSTELGFVTLNGFGLVRSETPG
jgi:hypothetical protein